MRLSLCLRYTYVLRHAVYRAFYHKVLRCFEAMRPIFLFSYLTKQKCHLSRFSWTLKNGAKAYEAWQRVQIGNPL